MYDGGLGGVLLMFSASLEATTPLGVGSIDKNGVILSIIDDDGTILERSVRKD